MHRLPARYHELPWVEASGLMFYGLSYADMFRRAAHYADRILKGANPADLRIAQPRQCEFHINVRTVHEIGLEILRFSRKLPGSLSKPPEPSVCFLGFRVVNTGT
jgi:ABC-type uncharacterized transport system substrate-binding protein